MTLNINCYDIAGILLFINGGVFILMPSKVARIIGIIDLIMASVMGFSRIVPHILRLY
jgi:hypothetical protein